MKNRLLFLLLTILSLALTLQSSVAAPQLSMTVSMNVQHGEKEVTTAVTVTGKVLDPYNNPVQGAAISSQVTDPRGNSVHIALIYSKTDGGYVDEFVIGGTPLSGNYTLHLTASKPGYADRNLHVPFSLASGAFTLKVSPNSRTLRQGSNTSFEIAILPLQGESMPTPSIRIVGLPQRITYNLLNKSATTAQILILTLITHEDTPVGTYNFTIIGEGRAYSHSTWAILEVTGATQQTSEPPPATGNILIPTLAIPAAIVILGGAASILIFKRLRASRLAVEEPKLEPDQDMEYLAIARALTRLEELRATEKLDQETYRKLKKEYEEKLERARRNSG